MTPKLTPQRLEVDQKEIRRPTKVGNHPTLVFLEVAGRVALADDQENVLVWQMTIALEGDRERGSVLRLPKSILRLH